ncbi:uncharacterized protein LOC141657039 [Silene latifolia]|uniref:uncharacterized protein LOC141657039 n=1 Tax=Silene latifolia TaxID=37657 RepID=UPI003D7718BB
MVCVHHQLALAFYTLSTPTHHHRLSPQTTSLNLTKLDYYQNNRRGDRHLLKSRRSILLEEEEEEERSNNGEDYDRLSRFEEAVKLFNEREYYACHDVLESLWYESNDPLRTLLHALLQCAVAFHHLFNQNHKGAMMEFGEGVCKLRKLNLNEGPFHEFEQQISCVLNFIYNTQLELAACNEDFCVEMEQNERSYQLLQGFGAGQRLYVLEEKDDGETMEDVTHIVFDPVASYGATGLPRTRVKLPTLQATRDHLIPFENY